MATSTNASYNQILEGATAGESDKPDAATTRTYRDFLTKLWLLEPLEAWDTADRGWSRLVRAPKHHLVDPGLAARLIDLDADSLLGTNPSGHFGALFESLVVMTLRVLAQSSEARLGHLRTKGGEREIDIVATGHNGNTLAIEVKSANRVTDHDVRHLLWFKENYEPKVVDLAVVYTGKHAYRRPDGVAVIPLALLGP